MILNCINSTQGLTTEISPTSPYLVNCNGSFGVLASLVGVEIETSRVHAAVYLTQVRSDMRQVTLRRTLHLRELATEGDNSPPQVQQTRVFG